MARKQKGQVTQGIMAVVIAAIALIVGIFVFSGIEASMPELTEASTTQTEYPGFGPDYNLAWENSSTGSAANGYDSANEWVDVKLSGTDVSGTSDYRENCTLDAPDGVQEVKKAEARVAYRVVSTGTGIIDSDNFYLKVEGPGGGISEYILQKLSGPIGWCENTIDVSEAITEGGTYAFHLYFEGIGDNFEANWDNCQLSVDVDAYTSAGAATEAVKKTTYSVYSILPIILVVMVCALIIGVLFKLGGSA